MLQKLDNQGFTFTDDGRVIVVDKYGAVKRLTNLTLTTIGTSGPATLIGNVLNIPDYTEIYFGTVTSVGLSMPAAFTVTNSPITTAGTIAVTAAGLVSQYIRGDGTLADFPGSTGGGSSVSYYLNGSVNQGVFGGNTYYQMSRTPVVGAGTNFSIAANGYIASFITDANDPSLISIPSGGWNIQLYMSANLSGGSPNFYIELYKYDGAVFTLISSSSTTPESITGGTSVDLYYTSISVPTTALTVTDRLAIRVYVNNSGRTITLYTEGTNLAEIVTTFTTGLTALNGLTAQVQYLTTGTSGTDFTISSSTATHTFNLPVASALNTGKLSNTDWTTFNAKQDALSLTTTGSSGPSTLIGSTLNVPEYTLAGLGGVPTSRTLTVNGTAYDLSADRSWSVGTVTSVAATAGTGISISGSPITGSGTLTITNTAPDQTVALTAGTGIGVSGTYPNFTITNTSPSSGGTVTSVAALTLGTTGTDLSSTVANPTTTPVITLNVPTASATNRGALSSADWSTFNAKQNAITLTTTGSSGASTFVSNTLNIPTYTLAGLGGVSGTGTTNYLSKWTSSSALGNSLVYDDGTNIGIGTITPSSTMELRKATGTNYLYLSNGASGTNNGVVLRYNSVDYMGMIGNFTTGELKIGGFNASGYFMTFYSNNAERMRLTPSGRLLIGTSTESTYELDVVGDIRSTLDAYFATSSGSVGIGFTSTAFNTVLQVKGPSANPNNGIILTTNTWTSLSAGTGVRIGTGATSGNTYGVIDVLQTGGLLANGALSIAPQGGSVLIGTTTDAGYKLDVSGTLRSTQGANFATSSGNVGILTTSPTNLLTLVGSTTGRGIDFVSQANFASVTGKINYETTNDLFSIINTSNWGNSALIFGTSNTERARFNVNGNFMVGTTTDVASAILQLSSTTKGFLPPRMTTTQKTSISTPATGLVVFDTTLAKLCVYTGAAWETVTSA